MPFVEWSVTSFFGGNVMHELFANGTDVPLRDVYAVPIWSGTCFAGKTRKAVNFHN
jgi:hypothetical protein